MVHVGAAAASVARRVKHDPSASCLSWQTPKFKREHGEARKKKAAEEVDECVS